MTYEGYLQERLSVTFSLAHSEAQLFRSQTLLTGQTRLDTICAFDVLLVYLAMFDQGLEYSETQG